MEERIASDKNKCSAVKLGRAQNSEARPWERGILMPSQDEEGCEIMNILRQLTPEYLVYALALAKGARFADSQDTSASPLATSGK